MKKGVESREMWFYENDSENTMNIRRFGVIGNEKGNVY